MTTFDTATSPTTAHATLRTAGHILLPVGFALLTAIGAQISIPTIPVPFTLQTLFVLLSGALLGARRGAMAQALYLAAGAAGAPVFAGFSGSFLHLLGPTGGYLFAFPVAAFVAGAILHDVPAMRRVPSFVAALVAMSIAMVAIFLAGVVQLNLVVFHNWSAAFGAGFLHLQAWDAAKILGAALLYSQIGRRIAL